MSRSQIDKQAQEYVAGLGALGPHTDEDMERAWLEGYHANHSAADSNSAVYAVASSVDQQGITGWLKQSRDFSDRAEAHTELARIRHLAVLSEFAPELFFVAVQVGSDRWERDGELTGSLTSSAAAELLGVSRSTLMQWVREGFVPAKQVGAHYQFDKVTLEEVAQKREQARAAAFQELRAWDEAHDTDEPQ